MCGQSHIGENMEETISFEDLGLDEQTLAAITRKGFETPSPIQVLAIPRLLNGDTNVIARARTGTGKTAAFGLPIVQKLRDGGNHVRALILEPTRELAVQTCREMLSFSDGSHPSTCVVYGGASMSEQIRAIKRGADIVAGTPGRVQDLLERGVLDISKIEYFILDEGDEMLDMGFIEDIENIFAQANENCRILLFSATMPAPILKIAQKFMGEYEIVEEEGIVEEPLLIDQKYWMVRESDKIEALVRLIDSNSDFFGLVFTQTKNDADNVSKKLDERGYEVAALHGDIPQSQREKVLARFRSKKTRILVATDVAARGIDINGLSHVVNYSLPFDGSTYVHRIGRTGRAGSAGCAVTFVCPNERRKLNFLKMAVSKASKGDLDEGQIPTIDSVIKIKQENLFDEMKISLGLKKPVVEDSSEPKYILAENTEGEETLPKYEDGELISVNENFEAMAEELCAANEPKKVLAAVLSVLYGKKLDRSRYGKIDPVKESKKRDFGAKANDDPNQTRLYIQLGRRDGYGARTIAEYFSDLLNIPGRLVDRIDVATNFSLVSLPNAEANRVLEMANRDASIPHIHVDTKSGGSKGGDRKRGGFGGGRGGRDRDRSGKDYGRGGRGEKSSGFGGKHGRVKPHTATERTGSSSSYLKKKSSAKEF